MTRSTGEFYGTDGDVTVEAVRWDDGTFSVRTLMQEEADAYRAAEHQGVAADLRVAFVDGWMARVFGTPPPYRVIERLDRPGNRADGRDTIVVPEDAT